MKSSKTWSFDWFIFRNAKDVVIAGAVTHGDKDFTPESVRVSHDKPQPTVAKPIANKQTNRIIHQPR